MTLCAPSLKTQLNDGTPTASTDCAVCTIIMLFDAATCGKYIATVKEVRTACGVLSGGLSLQAGQTAVQVIRPRAETRYGKPIDIRYYIRPTPLSELKADLKAGYGIYLPGDYDQIPDQYSGQPSFDDNHALFIRGWRWLNGQRQVRDFDPLFDGRHPSTPDGPMLVPFSVMVAFAQKYAKTDGTFVGIAAKQGTR